MFLYQFSHGNEVTFTITLPSYANLHLHSRTFQEELLSHRRLYFLKDQVVFACHQMVCCESQGGAELAEDTLSMKKYSANSLESAWFDSLTLIAQNIKWDIGTSSILHHRMKRQRLKGLWELIVEYSNRNLTYDSDALKALAGICRVFEEGEYPIYNLQGLPVVPFTESGSSSSTMELVSALCWHHDVPRKACRRMQFPSWTWAGWTSRIEHPDSTNTDVSFEVDSRHVRIGYEDGHLATLEELRESLQVLHLETSRNRHFTRVGRSDDDIRDIIGKERDWSGPKTIMLYAPAVAAKHFQFPDYRRWEGGTFAGLDLHFEADRYEDKMILSPIEFGKGLVAGTLGCILLRVDNKVEGYRNRRAHLLLFQWQEGSEAQRIGKLTAKESRHYNFKLDTVLAELKWVNVHLK
jgi:hypothetical protein